MTTTTGTTITGGCLCGAVRYESTGEPILAGHCQCADCRKLSGTGHTSVVAVPEQTLTVTGKVTRYNTTGDSGGMVRRIFCPTCGTPLYGLVEAMPGTVMLRASSLDDPEVFEPQMVIFTSRAASWDHMDPALPAFPEMPPRDSPSRGGAPQYAASSRAR